jgi:hypothetical protein
VDRVCKLQAVDATRHLNIGESREMSERDSRIEIAWSALTASTGLNPASSTISTARMRRIISSSTIRTFGTGVKSVDSLVMQPNTDQPLA